MPDVTVTHADRVLFCLLFDIPEGRVAEVLAGKCDDRAEMRRIAHHAEQARLEERERAAIALETAIGEGYPAPADKTAQCEHGQFGWEDCIACYDDVLIALATAIRSGESA